MEDLFFLKKLEELGIKLPPAPTPVAGAAYDPAVQIGDGCEIPGTIWVSGQIPDVEKWGGRRLGENLTDEELVDAARECTLKALAALVAKLVGGTWQSDFFILGAQATVFILAPGAEFGRHPSVANGATEVLKTLGIPVARSAIGVSSLPFGVPVEVQLNFAFYYGRGDSLIG